MAPLRDATRVPPPLPVEAPFGPVHDPSTEPVVFDDVVSLDGESVARVVVVSDIHLAPAPTPASAWATAELVRLLRAWDGPGTFVLNGDIIELWAGDTDAHAALAAHPEFTTTVREFAASPGRNVYYLPGNHDGPVAWDPLAAKAVTDELGATLAFALDITSGGRRVRIEHGNRFDPSNRFSDPRSPHDTPAGQHFVQEIMPLFDSVAAPWLDGIDCLAGPEGFPAFISSRILYRRMIKHLWWLLVPLAIAVLSRIPLAFEFGARRIDFGPFADRLLIIDASFITFSVVLLIALVLAARRSWRAAAGIIGERRGLGGNDRAVDAATAFVARGGAGLVTGHTHQAELRALPDGDGFYANSGSCTRVIERLDGRFGLPDVFAPHVQLAWVDLRATGAGWNADLWYAQQPLPGLTRSEQLIVAAHRTAPTQPTAVARLSADGIVIAPTLHVEH